MPAQYRAAQALGWLLSGPNVTSTFQLNAAANRMAYSFVPDAARTLSAVRAYVSAVAGTLGASDITCDLYDSTGTNGAPGSSIETGKLPSSTITGAGWYDFTGFATALTANQQYWAVLTNVNGTPASNNCTFRVAADVSTKPSWGSTQNRQGWGTGTSTNSGSTYTSNATRSGHRVAYADSTYDGVPTSNAAAAAVGDGVYSSRESGVKFTSPANATLRVAGLAMYVASKTGSPTGSPRLGLWTGSSPSLLAYTADLPTTAIATNGMWVWSYFSSVQTIAGGTVCRVTLAETTQSDASGNRWNNFEVTWDTDSNSTILLPWDGSCQKTYYDGSSWTDTAGSLFGHALLLDTAQEFQPITGGGGLFVPLIPSMILG